MMNRAAFKFICSIFVLIGCLPWYSCHADQQTAKDDGVDFAKGLMGSVVDGAKNSSATTVPGYTTTALPETSYYGSQDLGGMQTDAQTLVTTGAGNDAAQFAYEQSTVPKLLFSDTDPLITTAGTIGNNTVLDPSVLTVKTGDCTATNVSSADTNIEHCTAWMIPTTHTCSKTLAVNVTWSDAANCPVGEGFAEVSALGWDWSSYGTALPTTDWVHARAVCNPGLSADVVQIELMAEGAYGSCTGWRSFTVSTNQPNSVLAFSGSGTATVDLAIPEVWFAGSVVYCSDPHLYLNDSAWIYPFVQGQCTNGICDYTITFYSDYNGVSLGTHPLHLIFDKPAIATSVPTVTETWSDTCGYLEAQVAP